MTTGIVTPASSSGLPYLPGTWPINVFMAMKGKQTTEWLQNPEKRAWGKYPDIKKALELGKMSSDVVQAINRIRSRKVINDAGDCETSDVYLMLPARRDEAETLLDDIRSLMPGVVIAEDWKVETQKTETQDLQPGGCPVDLSAEHG